MEFQLSYFKSLKRMLWKCCTQYVSKFGKLTSGHNTRKGQFLFQSQRKAGRKESYDQPRQHIKKQRHYFASKGLSSQGYGLSSSHVWMWELDCKESWAVKNWCFWTVLLEKTLESPLDCKEIQPVHPKGNQSSIFIGRTDIEAEVPILWPPDVKRWLIRKDPYSRKDWRQEAKGTTEDKMVEWHHRLNGYEFEQALGDGEGQGSLACCSPWGRKESDTTEWLNNEHTNLGGGGQVCTETLDWLEPEGWWMRFLEYYSYHTTNQSKRYTLKPSPQM